MSTPKFTENTLVPVSIIGAIVVAAGWITTIWYQGQANAQDIEMIQADRKSSKEKINDKLDEIIARLIRLEERQR